MSDDEYTHYTVLGFVNGQWYTIASAYTGVPEAAIESARNLWNMVPHPDLKEKPSRWAAEEARFGPGVDWSYPMPWPPGYEPEGIVEEES